jgi:predicted molibdopterin-dependent oxidoreductase YjgC
MAAAPSYRQATITVDGLAVAAAEGEMLAAALLAAGYVQLRNSPTRRMPRGAFCLMGVCQECLVRVDGTVRQACLTSVKAGMRVELGSGPDRQ